jgi:mannose-1-phosphate guanylyltransferase
MSTPSLPKHFLPIVNGRSLFQKNWDLLRKRYEPEEIYLQTNASQAKMARMQAPDLVSENIFIEPETRNQGPATGLAAAFLTMKGLENEPFMLVQVDDLRLPESTVFDFIDLAEKQARETDKYITSGFVPKWHMSGVDYMLRGELVAELGGVEIFEVADFIDRKEVERIEEHMHSGKMLIHTNHTTMKARGLLDLYKDYKPEWYEPLADIINGGSIEQNYTKMPKGQLEEVTQIAHRSGRSLVIENPFEWIDFGTWESVSKYYEANSLYPVNGGSVEIDGANNFLWSESNKTIATIGLSDIVVIESAAGILVSKKQSSGQVNQVVDKLNSGDL